jgi:hypothetical protein
MVNKEDSKKNVNEFVIPTDPVPEDTAGRELDGRGKLVRIKTRAELQAEFDGKKL